MLKGSSRSWGCLELFPPRSPSRTGTAEPAGAEPRPAAALGTAGAVGGCSSTSEETRVQAAEPSEAATGARAEPYSPREDCGGPGLPGGGARHSPLRPAPRPGRAPCAPSGPAAGPGRVKTLRDAVARGGPVPAALRGRARRSPSMSLVTVLKCIFCGRQPGRAGALRPPRRSSSAPFPACSAAAATEIREAILKAFALGDRGLFSSIGETPMQEQQPRQPPTTSPPSHPLTPLLSTAPSREVRARPPSFQTGGGGGGGKLKKKKKQKTNPTTENNPNPLSSSPPREGRWGARNFPGALCSQRRAPQRAGSSPVSGRGTGGTGE